MLKKFRVFCLGILVLITSCDPLFDTLHPDGPSSNKEEDELSGSGTKFNPYLISSVKDLRIMAKEVNSGKVQDEDYFILTKDIDLFGDYNNQWEPIGSDKEPFVGNFNGNGHKIRGLYIDTHAYCQALFGRVAQDGVIQNLGVSGEVTATDYVGGIVGYLEGGLVLNCYSEVEVDGEKSVGGIVGYNYIGDIVNSYSVESISGDSYVGGIVGYNSNGWVENSYNVGDVSGYSNLGGVAGYSLTSIPLNYSLIGCVDDIASNGRHGTQLTNAQMKSSEFVDLLNDNAQNCNDSDGDIDACDWVYNAYQYPKLDFDVD